MHVQISPPDDVSVHLVLTHTIQHTICLQTNVVHYGILRVYLELIYACHFEIKMKEPDFGNDG